MNHSFKANTMAAQFQNTEGPHCTIDTYTGLHYETCFPSRAVPMYT
jgi:hypothetical protein